MRRWILIGTVVVLAVAAYAVLVVIPRLGPRTQGGPANPKAGPAKVGKGMDSPSKVGAGTAAPAIDWAPVRPIVVGPGDWPGSRGGPSLTGVAVGSLSDKLTLKWRVKTGSAIKSSPAIAGGVVFIGSGDDKVYAIELASGKPIWTHKAGGSVDSGPLVHDGRVYVGCKDGSLYALDAATGRQKWRVETGGEIPGSPNWLAGPDGKTRIVFGSYDFKLYCVDAAGQELWKAETGNYLNGTPAVGDGVIVMGSCDEKLYVVSAEDGSPISTVEVGSFIFTSAALAGGRAYFARVDKQLLCVDPKGGAIEWRYEPAEPVEFYSSPAVGKDVVLIGGRDGRLHCVGRADGKPRWTFATRDNVDSSPVIVGDKVVFGSGDGRLYVVKLADGKEVFSYDVGEAITASPAVAGGMVVIGAEDGYVYAFGPG